MKCAKIIGPKKIDVGEIEEPTSKEGRVVIKIERAGICGSDIHYWDVGSPEGLVMGHEISGTVLDPGARTDLNVGDRVTSLPISPCGKCYACKTGNPQYCTETWTHALGLSLDNPGGYAEITSFRPDMVRRLPDEVSFEEGAMVEPSAVSLHAVSLLNLKMGDKVLIVGGGIIGLMAAEFAKLSGASYIALLETNEKRGHKAVTVGKVDEYFDAKDEKVIERLKEKTNGGFDAVIECCGNAPAITEAIMCTRNGGKIALVGVSLGTVDVPLTVAVMGEMTLYGAIAYTERDFDTCIDLIARKKINVKKYIDDVVPLERCNESFERLTSGNDSAIKILLNPNE